MDIAALITWVLAAGGGFVLLGTWLRHRDRQETGPSRIGPGLIFGHFLLAAAGLVVWLVYVLAAENAALRWVALVTLLVVAVLGFSMFLPWLRDRRAGATDPPEQRFPVAVVGAHGLLGAATLILVALIAFGVGQS